MSAWPFTIHQSPMVVVTTEREKCQWEEVKAARLAAVAQWGTTHSPFTNRRW